MPDNLLQLKRLVNSIGQLEENDWNAFSSIWESYSAKRKTVITSQGDTERYLYFVLEGVQRVYYLDALGREATLVFTYPPSFGGVIDSLLLHQPSRYFYETITSSKFLKAPFAKLEKLLNASPDLERIFRQGTAGALSGVLERLVELQCYSSEEKFRKLLARSPHILKVVPHKYLANYIGIDATNFSKLMNKIQI